MAVTTVQIKRTRHESKYGSTSHDAGGGGGENTKREGSMLLFKVI